jgi:hypothetical protein
VVEVGTMLPAVAPCAVHALGFGLCCTVLTSIYRHARTVERGHAGGKAQTLGGGRRDQTVACWHPGGIEGIPSPPSGVIIEVCGGHAGRTQSRRGLMVEASGAQGQGLIETPKTIESHGFDRLTSGEVPPFGVLRRRVVHAFANATFVTYARDTAQRLQDLTAVGLFHVLSSPEELLPTPKIAQIPSRVCGMSAAMRSWFGTPCT